jgi:hypothetical protein
MPNNPSNIREKIEALTGIEAGSCETVTIVGGIIDTTRFSVITGFSTDQISCPITIGEVIIGRVVLCCTTDHNTTYHHHGMREE